MALVRAKGFAEAHIKRPYVIKVRSCVMPLVHADLHATTWHLLHAAAQTFTEPQVLRGFWLVAFLAHEA